MKSMVKLQPLPQRANHVDDGPLGQDVERGRRLVEDDQLRFQQEAERDRNALPHTAAELVRIGGKNALAVELDHAQQLERALARLSVVLLAVRAGRLDEMVPHLEDRVERVQRRLEDHGAFLPAKAPQVAVAEGKEIERAAVAGAETGASAGDPRGAGQQAEQGETQRRFAGPALADQGDGFAGANLERRATHRLHRTGRRLVLDPEILDREHDVVRQIRRSDVGSRTSEVGSRHHPITHHPITRHPTSDITRLAIVD